MDTNSQECLYNYRRTHYGLQLKLYSHSSNVSTERLEMLFWTSRLGLISIPKLQHLGLVTLKSRCRLSLETDVSVSSRYHTSHLQPCISKSSTCGRCVKASTAGPSVCHAPLSVKMAKHNNESDGDLVFTGSPKRCHERLPRPQLWISVFYETEWCSPYCVWMSDYMFCKY